MAGRLKNNHSQSKRGGARPGAGRKPGVPNKATAELKDLAREYTTSALETLANIMVDGESEAARVSAANAILDRGYGKPSQTIDAGENITNMLAAIIADRRTKVASLNG